MLMLASIQDLANQDACYKTCAPLGSGPTAEADVPCNVCDFLQGYCCSSAVQALWQQL